MKRNPFKHVEVVRLEYATNWDESPKENPKDADVHKYSSSYLNEITSLMHYISKLVSTTISITPLASHSERTSK